MGDILMNVCREAGEQLADPRHFPALPAGSLPDQAAKIKFVMDIENQITADINAVLGMIIPSVVACVRADHSLNNAADACLTGQPPNTAAGMAMRFYAGFLDMAKTLREKSIDGTVITSEQRTKDMDIIHGRAQKDEVYAAGARFGWWGIKRPDRPQPETVFDNGISDAYKKLYLADYYHEKKPSAGEMPPAMSGS